VPYISQASGVFLAQSCGASVLLTLLFARLFNVFCATAVYCAAIRIVPIGKWTMVLLGLTPMSLFISASASADAMTNAVVAMFVATVLRMSFDSGARESRRFWCGLLVLAVLLGQVKQGYYPLIWLAMLIPSQVTERRRAFTIRCLALVATTAVSVAVWGLVVRATYSPILDRVDPSGQWEFIRTRQAEFLDTLLSATLGPEYLARYFEQFLGVLGTLDTPLPAWLLWTHALAILIVAARSATNLGRFSVRQKLWIASIVLGNYVLMALTIYLTWMGVGDHEIRMQGRYFIPLGIPVCWLFHGCWPGSGTLIQQPGRSILVLMTIELVVVVLTLKERYFG
jgi:uncharacterized membrane protein